MPSISFLKLFQEEDSLMVALFGEPSALPDGWLENLPAAAVFAGAPDGLPREVPLTLDEVARLVPLQPRFQPTPAQEPAMVPAHTAESSLLAAVLRSAHLLVGRLSPDQLQALADRCLAAERPDLALPLLDAVGADPAARLAAARCRLALGQARAARADLEALIDTPALNEQPELLARACDALAWLALAQSDLDRGRDLLGRLQQLPVDGEGLERRDLLARVISTLDWLAQAPPDAVGSSRQAEDGLTIALDEVRISPCGSLLKLAGWRLGPHDAIAHLVLLCGQQALPLPLGSLQNLPRPDLAGMLAQAGLPDDTPAGFRLAMVQGVEEAAPPPTGGDGHLFVVLRNGEQFCLRQPLHELPLDGTTLAMPFAGLV